LVGSPSGGSLCERPAADTASEEDASMLPENTGSGGSDPKPVARLGIGTIVRHLQFGAGRIVAYEPGQYVIAFRGGDTRRVAMGYDALEVEERKGDPETDRIRQAVRDVLGDHGWIDVEIEMAPRWTGGTLKLIPGKADVVRPEDFRSVFSRNQPRHKGYFRRYLAVIIFEGGQKDRPGPGFRPEGPGGCRIKTPRIPYPVFGHHCSKRTVIEYLHSPPLQPGDQLFPYFADRA
jgi:hypothetical protein